MMIGSSYKSTSSSFFPSWSDLSDSPVFDTSDLVGEIKKNLEILSSDLLFDPDSALNQHSAPVEFLVSQPVYTSYNAPGVFNDSALSVIDFDEAGSAVHYICESPLQCDSPLQYDYEQDSSLSSPSDYYSLAWEEDLFSAAVSETLRESDDASSFAASSSRSELIVSSHAEQSDPEYESSSDVEADSSISFKRNTPPVRHRSKSEQSSARPSSRKRSTITSALVSPLIPCSPLISSTKRRRRTSSYRKPSSSVVQNLNLQYADTIVHIVDSLTDEENVNDDILIVTHPIAALRSSPQSPSIFVGEEVVTLSKTTSSTEDEDEDVDIL